MWQGDVEKAERKAVMKVWAADERTRNRNRSWYHKKR
jgi:hypothetical protein